MRHILSFLSIGIIVLLIACQNNTEQKTETSVNPALHQVIVEEIIQAKTYTYLKLKEGTKNYWAAIAKKEVRVGKTYFYNTGLEMKNFKSKELQRTFKTIYFIDQLSEKSDQFAQRMPANSPHKMKPSNQRINPMGKNKKAAVQRLDISIKPIKDGISIAELFSNRNSYADKTVKIKGQVVKLNSNIMGRNWVHIQDGTNASGNFDLTITTNEVVQIGEVVAFEGKIAINRDFGAGYFYEVIMEQAKQLQ